LIEANSKQREKAVFSEHKTIPSPFSTVAYKEKKKPNPKEI